MPGSIEHELVDGEVVEFGRVRIVARATPAAVIGALAGTRASDRVPTRQLRFGFAALLVGVAAFLLVRNAGVVPQLMRI